MIFEDFVSMISKIMNEKPWFISDLIIDIGYFLLVCFTRIMTSTINYGWISLKVSRDFLNQKCYYQLLSVQTRQLQINMYRLYRLNHLITEPT